MADRSGLSASDTPISLVAIHGRAEVSPNSYGPNTEQRDDFIDCLRDGTCWRLVRRIGTCARLDMSVKTSRKIVPVPLRAGDSEAKHEPHQFHLE